MTKIQRNMNGLPWVYGNRRWTLSESISGERMNGPFPAHWFRCILVTSGLQVFPNHTSGGLERQRTYVSKDSAHSFDWDRRKRDERHCGSLVDIGVQSHRL